MFYNGEGMAKTLDFFQIYFSDEQKQKLYPFAIPYKNETLTEYFENSVIAELVPKSNADLIAVCSWRLKQKRGDSSTPMILNGDLSLTEEKILNNDFDVAVLTPRSPRHQPLYMASQWHGRAWDDAFNELKTGFLFPRGIKIKAELSKAIYENHFIAKREIYHTYVAECLTPAIEFMRDKEIFKADSGYVRKKKDPKEIKAYQEKSGRYDWPISVFILERLFSIYIEGKGFKIIDI